MGCEGMSRWRLLLLVSILAGILAWTWVTGRLASMPVEFLVFSACLPFGVFLLRQAYSQKEPTRAKVGQELAGFAIVTFGVVALIASITFLGR